MNKLIWITLFSLFIQTIGYADEVKMMSNEEFLKIVLDMCKKDESSDSPKDKAPNDLLMRYVENDRAEILNLRQQVHTKDEQINNLQTAPKESSNGTLWLILGVVAGGAAGYFGARSIK